MYIYSWICKYRLDNQNSLIIKIPAYITTYDMKEQRYEKVSFVVSGKCVQLVYDLR
jgi:hypothetical protein